MCVFASISEQTYFCPIQYKLVGFYNRDEKCLLRSTDWVFKQSGLRFVCKDLNVQVLTCTTWLLEYTMISYEIPFCPWLHCLVCPSQFNFSDYNVYNWRSDLDNEAKGLLNLLVTDFSEKLQKNRTHLCYFNPTSKRLTCLEQHIKFTLETWGLLSTSESYNAFRVPRVCMAWHDP
jgi:hypothetical protein